MWTITVVHCDEHIAQYYKHKGYNGCDYIKFSYKHYLMHSVHIGCDIRESSRAGESWEPRALYKPDIHSLAHLFADISMYGIEMV